MASITGRATKFGYDVKASGSFGTATALTKLLAIVPGSFNQGRNVNKLRPATIGTGESMPGQMYQGGDAPTLGFKTQLGYNNNTAQLLAVYFGTSAAPGAEQTEGQSDYLHRIKFNSTRNANYLTMAGNVTSSELMEWVDVWINEVSISMSQFSDFVVADFKMGASQRIHKSASQVNTYAGIAALSAPSRDEAIVKRTHRFRLNSDSGGALANGDTVAVTNVEIKYSCAQESVSEMKGSEGVSPRENDDFMGTIAITLKDMTSFTYYDAAQDGTTYKADLEVIGSQIGSGLYKKIGFNYPLLKVCEDPQYAPGNPGFNPHVVVFDMLKRTSSPTGMNDSYPYIDIVNDLSTSLLA